MRLIRRGSCGRADAPINHPAEVRIHPVNMAPDMICWLMTAIEGS